MRDGEAGGWRARSEGWPMLGAFVESAVDDRLIVTFALSDVLPAGKVDAVVLGVDALRDDVGHRVTVYVVFEEARVDVYSRSDDDERRHGDAEISFPEGAVSIVLDGPRVCLDSQPDVRAFTVIDGVTRQDRAPVTLLPA